MSRECNSTIKSQSLASGHGHHIFLKRETDSWVGASSGFWSLVLIETATQRVLVWLLQITECL